MKANFAKALALALVLMLTLSGCNLIEVDAKMQADEEIAKINEKYSKAVASYDGGEITVAEAIGDFNSYYNEMAYMYYYYLGTDLDHEQIHTMMEDVLAEHVRAEIVAAKFDEGNALADEDVSAMEEDIDSSYQEYLASALESAEGKTEEQKNENARVILQEYGVGYEELYNNILTNTKATRMEELLRAEITEVSDEELQQAYDAKVIEQRESYADGSSFESAMSGENEIVCYVPRGYRTVKHILVMPADEIQTAYNDSVTAIESAKSDLESLANELSAAEDETVEEGERSAEEVQAEIDAINANLPGMEEALENARMACLDDVKETTDAIYARLEAGEDFEALMVEYGEDPGMMNEPTMSRGYYVSAASQNWESNFRDGAMALENVGDYSAEPVVSGSGVHIIYYNSDAPAGMVALSEVHDALYAEALEEKQNAHCDETIAAWVEAANAVYDVEGFEAAFEEE